MEFSKLTNAITDNKCFICLTFIVLLIVGCSGSSSKINVPESSDVKTRLPLIPTEKFLVVQKFNKEGLSIPYDVSENPYTKKKSKIKKASIASFINAKRSMDAKNYAEAEKQLKSLTQNDKRLSGPWVMLGDIALQRKELSKAIESYSKAIDINSRNVNAYLKLAHARRLNGEYDVAQNIYAKALSKWKDFPEAHLNLGVLYDVYLNRSKQAQRHIESYLFLAGGKDDQARAWLDEIKSRTGMKTVLQVDAPNLRVKE